MKNKKLLILIILAILIIAPAIFLKYSPDGTKLLWTISRDGQWLLPLVIVSAILDSFNPCAFSILLLTIAFLFQIGKLRFDILKLGLIYVFGIFVAYLAIGLGILQALHIFNTPHFMAKIGAWLMLILGLFAVLNSIWSNSPIKLRLPQISHRLMATLLEKGSQPTLFILGALVGLCEFPCTGGPYLVVLGLLHDQTTRFNGLAYLLLYNLIFIVPLLIILFAVNNKPVLEKIQNWQKDERQTAKIIGGIAMFILGIFILFIT